MHFKFPKIAKEGHVFVLIFAVITIVGFFLSSILGLLLLILTIWCALFFRDPKRITPFIENAIISPADGIIQDISYSLPPADLELEAEEMLKISIFMNVFNVHINRSPVKGVVKNISYIPGKFFNASLDKASEYNERQSFLIETSSGTKVIMVQIAGLIARRIVKFVNSDTEIKAGEKVGLIRFGSRVDIYLPKEITPLVIKGQTSIGGETIIANLGGNQPKSIEGIVLDRP